MELTREGFSQETTQISILSRLLLLSCSTTSFSDVQMGKRPLMDEVEEYKYYPRSPKVSQPFSTENGVTGRTLCCTGCTAPSVRCSITANYTCSDRSPDANFQHPVHRPVLRGNLHAPCAWDRTLPGASGASVRCSGQVCNLPRYGTGRCPVSSVPASGA